MNINAVLDHYSDESDASFFSQFLHLRSSSCEDTPFESDSDSLISSRDDLIARFEASKFRNHMIKKKRLKNERKIRRIKQRPIFFAMFGLILLGMPERVLDFFSGEPTPALYTWLLNIHS